MINETFDDDIPDEETHLGEPVTAKDPEPKGDFKRVLSGRDVWFNAPIPGQFHAWKRYRAGLAAKYEVLKVRAKKNPGQDVLNELVQMSEKFDLTTLELIESLIVNPDDVDFIQFEMISGRITMSHLYAVLFGEEEPDDDTEPAPRAKRTPAKKAVPKKTANATRTKK